MDFFSNLKDKIKDKVEDATHDVFHRDDEDRPGGSAQAEQRPEEHRPQQPEHRPEGHHDAHHDEKGAVNTNNRFQSFSPQTSGDAKWYVDGASYFWAVSEALEQAQESIYILDWWLSPELYLRRPPSKNEKYRLDNMLKAAAERGVKVNIIVYKEVTQVLTLNSQHTRHALEALHPNIKCFRHPDHTPTGYDLQAELNEKFSNFSINNLSSFKLSSVSGDALKSIYGSTGDVVLYWAHHEKLCVVDRKITFMGGLDMCFGRWDTSSHPIADAHPGNLDNIVFPGQDFNNARVYDFEGVDNWDHNKLDRTKSSRMGWSDISISLSGAIVQNTIDHFFDRWNFIYQQKYDAKDPGKYEKFVGGQAITETYRESRSDGALLGGTGESLAGRDRETGGRNEGPAGGLSIQLCRSATEWSGGHPTEHSITNAYIEAINNAQHFIYIENQFFITATGDEQKPVANQVGRAIVDRIIRAHNERQPFKVIVLMPAVPAFAGDLKADDALGTRAIMEFQYNSINRGGHSIMEKLQQAGVDVNQYIHFYNLRNYDRLNTSSTLGKVEQESGVKYEDARREHDERVERPHVTEPGRDYSGDNYGRPVGDRQGEYDGQRREEYGRGGEDDYNRRQGGAGNYGQRNDNYGSGGDSFSRREDNYGQSDDRYGRGSDRFGGNRDDREERRGGEQRYGGEERYGEDNGYRGEPRRDWYDRERGYGDEPRYGGEQRDEQRGESQYERYQAAASTAKDQTWDTISSCYMENGPKLDSVPWGGSPESEIDAFVSEELYIHSKVLIADDRLVICGSANLNDRSQLGYHDSEIAVVIEGGEEVDMEMAGQPFRGSRFASSLRRYLFRKHLGLIPDQRWDQPTKNWTPISQDPNEYDWGSHSDRLVADPLNEEFWHLWSETARTNTDVFSKVFHNVPNDAVRTWEDYDRFFSDKFIIPGVEYKNEEEKRGKVEYGHVVRDEFAGGITEVKEWLGRVRGTLVEMPLQFLINVDDIAKEGMSLNTFTDEIYT